MVIERIIGTLVIRPAAVNTDTPFMCGLAVRLEGISATQIPITPKTEVGRFLWYHQDELLGEASEVSAGVFSPIRMRFYFDVHGRWKFDNLGDELAFYMQNDSGETGLTSSIYTRTLLRVT